MDWRDLLAYRAQSQDERNRNRGGLDLRAIATRPAAVAPVPEDDGGFFGGVGRAVEAVGGFFGGIGEGIYNSAKQASTGIGDVIGGEIALADRQKYDQKRQDYLKQFNGTDDDTFLSAAHKYDEEHKAERGSITKRAKKAQDVDTTKTAAAAAETFLNVVPIGSGIKQVGGQIVKRVGGEVGRRFVEGTAERAATTAAERATQALMNRTPGGAGRTIARNAGEGAAYGGAYGALQPLQQEGADADPNDIWQSALFGGALGGVFGGGASFLDKNVRAGVRGIPNATREAASNLKPSNIALQNPQAQELTSHLQLLNQQRDSLMARGMSEDSPALKQNAQAYADTLAQRNQVVRQITQGGYIKLPGSSPLDDAAASAEQARRQLTGETPTPLETTPNPLPTGRTDLDMPSRTSQQEILATAPDAPQALPTTPIDEITNPPIPAQAATADEATQLLLPQGNLPKPPSPAAAKRQFKSTGEAPEFVNTQRAGQRPINLPASTEDLSTVATRKNPKGEIVPIKNGAEYVSKEVQEGVQELQGLSHRFKKISPLTDLNTIAEELTRGAGGIKSKAGQVFENVRAKVQQANADVVKYNNSVRKVISEDFKTYNFTGEQWTAVNKWLNQQEDPAARQAAFQEIINKYGDDVANKAQSMFDEWSPRMRQIRDEYNETVTGLGHADRAMGDLGEFYWPRVYQQQSIKDKLTDVAGSVIDLKRNGMDKTGYNPNTMSGSTTASNMVLPGQQRSFSQAPIGSEFSRPTVGFTGHAKTRTAKSPVGEQVNPMEAVAKYLESVNAIKTNTRAVHDIRGVQAAIKALQKETGDNSITILSDVLDNVANPLLGKTNEIDRSLAKYHVGQKTLEYGGFIAKQLSRSQLLGSIRTVLAQTGQIPLLAAEVGPVNALKGLRSLFSEDMNKLMKQSDFLVSNKFMGNESPFSANGVKQMAQKGERAAGWAMDATAAAMGKASWAGAYLKGQAEGLTGKALIKEADRVAGKVVGNRTAGLRPSLYESRAAQGIAMYTLDINQVYQATKGYIGEKNLKALGTLVGAAWAYNLVYEGITGDPLVADPLGATIDAGGILASDDYLDENGESIGVGEKLLRAGGRLGGEALAYTPLGNVAGGIFPEQGVKLPFSGERSLTRAELFGDSQLGRYGASAPISAAFENPLYLLGIPGMAQAQRTYGGLEAYNNGESSTPAGNQRFEVDQNLENFIRALMFGQYQTSEGRQYIQELSRNARGQSSL